MAGDATHRTLAVFVKLPRPGEVKTRLVPALGAEGAARLYEALVAGVLAATDPGSDYERLVFYDPPGATEAVRAWLPAARLRRQAAGDLGERMADAFARCFSRGAGRVVLIGSDAPGIRKEDVLAAFSALERHDVVLGPAHDGGYYLVALRAPRPALFEGIAWSTGSVLAATLARARAEALSVATLRTLRDVDTLEDAQAEWGSLGNALRAASPELVDRLARVLAIPVKGSPPGS